MNALLMQMIAARATASGNSALLDMVSRLGGSNPDLMQDPQELLAKLAASGNPLITALAQQFSQRQATALHSANESVIDVEPGPTHDSADNRSAEVEELRQRLEAMSSELRTLRERCDLLAAALGACCLCWGQDPACRACRGRGGPGYAIPDEPLAQELVLPAIRTLRAQRASVNGVPPNLSQPPAEATA